MNLFTDKVFPELASLQGGCLLISLVKKESSNRFVGVVYKSVTVLSLTFQCCMFVAVLPLPLLSPALPSVALQEANYPNLPSTELGNPSANFRRTARK